MEQDKIIGHCGLMGSERPESRFYHLGDFSLLRPSRDIGFNR
jgi:hypothetical protein